MKGKIRLYQGSAGSQQVKEERKVGEEKENLQRISVNKGPTLKEKIMKSLRKKINYILRRKQAVSMISMKMTQVSRKHL